MATVNPISPSEANIVGKYKRGELLGRSGHSVGADRLVNVLQGLRKLRIAAVHQHVLAIAVRCGVAVVEAALFDGLAVGIRPSSMPVSIERKYQT